MRLSISKIKAFKACRRKYELKYIYRLKPIEKPESLSVGTNYHEKIESLYKTGDFDISDCSKESAMALAYKKYIYPKFKVSASEKWLDMKIGDDDLVGIADAIAEDGKIVEHKTTSADISEGGEYEYNLMWDEQILTYMLMTGSREMYYTVCRKPTIRQKKGESEWEFFQRMVEWYDEDTEHKIRCFPVERTDSEVEEFKADLEKIASEMNSCNNYYKNTQHCNCWGRRCEYSPVCLHYDPEQEYVDFIREDGEYVKPEAF